jgi:mannose-6-phosphate isomerase-like protein (cupin superfamily)
MHQDTLFPSEFEALCLPEKYDYLAPDGSEIRLLSKGFRGSLCHCVLPTGKVSKAVSHKSVEELWYCLAGEGKVWRRQNEKDNEVEVRPGTSLSIQPGMSFQFRNTGSEPLCFIIATMPPWPGPEEALDTRGRW